MCQLIETIKVESGLLLNLPYHNQRLNLARKNLWGIEEPIKLEKQIQFPDDLGRGLYKCRVLYTKFIESVAFAHYQLKPIRSLKLVEDGAIDYQYKWANRSSIEKLLNKKDVCDDILIVKNGCVTDTSYANIAFFDGTSWLTSSNPLLKGTKRQKLLDHHIIDEAEIKLSDLIRFQKAALFNAMIEFNPNRSIPIENIV